MTEQEIIKKLRDMAKKASEKAYSPYSHAKVGSALQTVNGNFYSGCNVENGSYGGTVCAERIAIFKAISEELSPLNYLYVYSQDGWPPCGMCRQVIAEFASPELKIIIGDEAGKERILPFSELFPLAFTPDHLLK